MMNKFLFLSIYIQYNFIKFNTNIVIINSVFLIIILILSFKFLFISSDEDYLSMYLIFSL